MRLSCLNPQKIAKAKKTIMDIIQQMPKVVVDINEEYDKKIRDKFDLIATNAIDDYYADYDPIYYDRLGDLYHTYKIIITDYERRIELSHIYMNGGHRASNEYIFDTMFVYGYHGGAPHNGEFYWREPIPYFDSWYPVSVESQGLVSDSPYYKIKEETDEYLEEAEAQEQEEVNKEIDKLLLRAEKAVNKII